MEVMLEGGESGRRMAWESHDNSSTEEAEEGEEDEGGAWAEGGGYSVASGDREELEENGVQVYVYHFDSDRADGTQCIRAAKARRGSGSRRPPEGRGGTAGGGGGWGLQGAALGVLLRWRTTMRAMRSTSGWCPLALVTLPRAEATQTMLTQVVPQHIQEPSGKLQRAWRARLTRPLRKEGPIPEGRDACETKGRGGSQPDSSLAEAGGHSLPQLRGVDGAGRQGQQGGCGVARPGLGECQGVAWVGGGRRGAERLGRGG